MTRGIVGGNQNFNLIKEISQTKKKKERFWQHNVYSEEFKGRGGRKEKGQTGNEKTSTRKNKVKTKQTVLPRKKTSNLGASGGEKGRPYAAWDEGGVKKTRKKKLIPRT